MIVVKYEEKYLEKTYRLLALFRVLLRSFKNVKNEADFLSAKEELLSFSKDQQYEIYVCKEEDNVLGYMILKLDGVVWVEQIFVDPNYRRMGVGSLLYEKAEEVSAKLGSDTLYNYVHPNNEAMINFLKDKGYTVLNLIEIRKPYKKENLNKKYKIGNNEFDY